MNNRQDLENFLMRLGFKDVGNETFVYADTYTVTLNYAANKTFLMSIGFYDNLADYRLADLNAALEDLKSKYVIRLAWIGHRKDANERLCSGQNLCYHDWKDEQVWLDNFKQLDWNLIKHE
jgi:hypothetical protein